MNPAPRERLIRSAITLVQRNGVAGTGLAELLEHSKTARGSIYSHFPGGKEELIETSTRVAGDFTYNKIATIAEGQDGRDFLRSYIGMWKNLLLDNDFDVGCPVAAAAVSPNTPGSVAVAGLIFESWISLVDGHLQGNGVSADRARPLAMLIVSAIEGALIICRAQRTTEPLDHINASLGELLHVYLSGDLPAPGDLGTQLGYPVRDPSM
ncbi:TetR/AcrR family transcriptional regulator [Mycobacteroides salmoniphilum]|uniref:TetR/AcrR family transcriptional regulator n=1 Tax=Mycobacteroides salmoniphilum TaxID=404941 RepID=UPI001065061C|nr:TetR/AcrR family transcriptional regulator [Mycobacteroides salmoniphilum]TDZ76889.1 putative HTH-type transcriptional regulator YxaF [Mycobacteroides salmoniphilum]TDZ86592.1 putative HTH-type transcriptional regulator YxaF [Mycobacteroides salmoniphilum]